MNKSVGHIVIDKDSNVILLTSLDNQTDVQGNGSVIVFDKGIVLRSEGASVCWPINIRFDAPMRIVGHVGEYLRLMEQNGADLSTPAEKSIVGMSVEQRLQKLEQENAKLRAQVK